MSGQNLSKEISIVQFLEMFLFWEIYSWSEMLLYNSKSKLEVFVATQKLLNEIQTVFPFYWKSSQICRQIMRTFIILILNLMSQVCRVDSNVVIKIDKGTLGTKGSTEWLELLIPPSLNPSNW